MKTLKDIFKLDLNNNSAVKQFYRILDRYRIGKKDKNDFLEEVKQASNNKWINPNFIGFMPKQTDEINLITQNEEFILKSHIGTIQPTGDYLLFVYSKVNEFHDSFGLIFNLGFTNGVEGNIEKEKLLEYFPPENYIELNEYDYSSNKIDAKINWYDCDSYINDYNDFYKRLIYLYNIYGTKIHENHLTIFNVTSRTKKVINIESKKSNEFIINAIAEGGYKNKYKVTNALIEVIEE